MRENIRVVSVFLQASSRTNCSGQASSSVMLMIVELVENVNN